MFRFTIREVLWRSALVVSPVGCWLVHSRLELENDRAKSRLVEAELHLKDVQGVL